MDHNINTPPHPTALRHLRPQTRPATLHTLGNITGLVCGLLLASPGTENWLSYLSGQLLLTLVFIHAFVLLHEAGHNTLYPQRALNRLTGHYAGFIALIPYASWKPVHANHHRYTGWQDLDLTTATLVPRPLRTIERLLINFFWRTNLPLFSILYRLQSYWHLPRIHRFLRIPQRLRNMTINAALLLVGYSILIASVGFGQLMLLILPALLLSLALEDILLLSQHTHIPQQHSNGEKVRSFKPMQQAQFSRSLKLPRWLSTILMGFDQHELHHMYPHVPGYRLHNIAHTPTNETHWLNWIRAAKRLSGVDFLFKNRSNSGSRI